MTFWKQSFLFSSLPTSPLFSWRKVFIAWSGGGKQSQKSACGHTTSGCDLAWPHVPHPVRRSIVGLESLLAQGLQGMVLLEKETLVSLHVLNQCQHVLQCCDAAFFIMWMPVTPMCTWMVCCPLNTMNGKTLGKGEEKLCIIFKNVCEHQWVHCEIPVTESLLQLLLWLIMTVLCCKTLEAVDPHYHWFNTRLHWNKAASLRYSVVSKRG